MSAELIRTTKDIRVVKTSEATGGYKANYVVERRSVDSLGADQWNRVFSIYNDDAELQDLMTLMLHGWKP